MFLFSCDKIILVYLQTYQKFSRGLNAINHGSEAEKIRTFVEEQCFPDPSTFENSKQDQYAPDALRFECRQKATTKYVSTLNDEKIEKLWNKYEPTLSELVVELKRCEEK